MLLHFLSTGKISKDARKVTEMVDLIHGQVGRKRTSIFTKTNHFASLSDDLWLCSDKKLLDITIMFSAEGLWHQHAHVSSYKLRIGVAKQELGRLVHAIDEASVVNGDDRVGSCSKDCSDAFFTLP